MSIACLEKRYEAITVHPKKKRTNGVEGKEYFLSVSQGCSKNVGLWSELIVGETFHCLLGILYVASAQMRSFMKMNEQLGRVGCGRSVLP